MLDPRSRGRDAAVPCEGTCVGAVRVLLSLGALEAVVGSSADEVVVVVVVVVLVGDDDETVPLPEPAVDDVEPGIEPGPVVEPAPPPLPVEVLLLPGELPVLVEVMLPVDVELVVSDDVVSGDDVVVFSEEVISEDDVVSEEEVVPEDVVAEAEEVGAEAVEDLVELDDSGGSVIGIAVTELGVPPAVVETERVPVSMGSAPLEVGGSVGFVGSQKSKICWNSGWMARGETGTSWMCLSIQTVQPLY